MIDYYEPLASGECIKVDISLITNVSSLSYELKSNKIYEDKINVYNDREQVMDIKVYSDNNRVKIENSIFQDKSAEITFLIDTNNLKPQDIIEGKISIVTNIGDRDIPFKYTIVYEELENLLNSLKSITAYYDLLVNDYNQAYKIFEDRTILKAPFMNDTFSVTVYDGLYFSARKDIALLEFFRAFNIDVFDKIPSNDSLLSLYADRQKHIDVNDYELENKNTEENIIEEDEETVNNKKIVNLLSKIQDKDLVNTLAITCVRSGKRNFVAFNVYKNTIYNGTSINGLFEKLLVAIPNDYKERLPMYVYQLYHEDKNYTFEQKTNLYENIICTFDENDDVYRLYNDEIKEYVTTQIYQNKVSDSLVKIYNRILDKSVINEHNNKNILYLLRCHKILIKNPNIRKVIVKYKELSNETKYDVLNNIAFVPIFFDTYVLLFEDRFGNRFFSEQIIIKNLFDRKDLETYCLERYPEDDILNVTRALTFKETMSLSNILDVNNAKSLIETNKFNFVVNNLLRLMIIDYFYMKAVNKEDILSVDLAYINDIKFSNIPVEYQSRIVSILYHREEYVNLFNVLCRYSINLIDHSKLVDAYVNIIKKQIPIDNDVFCNEVWKLVRVGEENAILVEHLANNFSGSIDDLVYILRLTEKLHISNRELSKRLLYTCLKINHSQDIDYIYNMYNYEKSDDSNLLMAYLTKKTSDFFLDNIKMPELVVLQLTNYLVSNLNNLDQVPFIYILAFTKYVSTLDYLSDNDMRRALIKCMDILLETDMIFAYYKKLNKHIKIPYSIMSKEYIEYHADRDFVPKAIFTVNGLDRERDIELYKVYKNIYIRSITVFKNEVISYKIYDGNNPTGILDSGTLTYEESFMLDFIDNNIKDSFSYINAAVEHLDSGNYEALRKTVNEMIINQKVTEDLFSIDDEGEEI